jgi:hypothetical protein
MHDIGYYAGFLSPADQEEINGASKLQLLDLLVDLGMNLASDAPTRALDLNDFWISVNAESERDKLSLIRGLCDRIELKLMEAAK